jgi:hypothetical protein
MPFLTGADRSVSYDFLSIAQYARWMMLGAWFADVDEVERLYQFLTRRTANRECKC